MRKCDSFEFDLKIVFTNFKFFFSNFSHIQNRKIITVILRKINLNIPKRLESSVQATDQDEYCQHVVF